MKLRSFYTSAALLLATFTLAVVAATAVATAQTYTDLYNFGVTSSGPLDPSNNVLAQGRDGNLYGSTYEGGAYGLGAIYKITQAGTLTLLYSFDGAHGENPPGGLALGTDGNFYGTTYGGGTLGWGTVFKITPKGTLTVLYNFTNGAEGNSPFAGLVQGTDGSFYGSTLWGNESSTCPNNAGGGCGAIFRITPSGTLTVLDALDVQVDGEWLYNIQAPLTQGADGNFYGSTINGGPQCCGTIFKMTPAGKLKYLASTSINQGASAYGTMAEGGNGNFYGATYFFGGDVFEITPAGDYTVLDEFNGATDGSWAYAGLILATDGNFYGATTEGGSASGGTIYQVSQSGALAVVWDFDGASGSVPYATLLQHTNGKLYGTANAGGTNGQGAIYSFDMGLPPFVRLAATVGSVGRSIGILGQGFTGTTAVSFNGTAATFTVVRDTYLVATVPTGTTTGFVTVTTPGGTLTSNKEFTVKP